MKVCFRTLNIHTGSDTLADFHFTTIQIQTDPMILSVCGRKPKI